MNIEELIKEAERLYKYIDKTQVDLISSRLVGNEEKKQAAINHMETLMCSTLQFLKCLIDRKDNIVEQCDTKDMEQKTENKVEGTDEMLVLVTESLTNKRDNGDVCKAGEAYVCVNGIKAYDGVIKFTEGKLYDCQEDNFLYDNEGVMRNFKGVKNFRDYFVKADSTPQSYLSKEEMPKKERVNHPDYYNSHPSGVECITIIRHHNFNIGSVIKYCWRNGLKTEEGMSDKDKQIEDLKKAIFYLNDEIKRLEEF